MPPKRAKRSRAKAEKDVTAVEPTTTTPEEEEPRVTPPPPPPLPAAPRNTRKRTRAAAAAAPAEVEVTSRASSVTSAPAPAVDVDEDEEAPARSTRNAATAAKRGRGRQTTLSGEILETPPRRAEKGSAGPHTAGAKATAHEGGELKPSKPAPPSNARRGAAAAPVSLGEGEEGKRVVEHALLGHLRGALTRYYITRSKRTISLLTVPSAANQSAALDALEANGEIGQGDDEPPTEEAPPHEHENAGSDAAEEEEETGSDEGVAEEEATAAAAAAPAAATPQETGAQGYFALPCVSYFMLKECARVARVVREEGGGGFGDNPSHRAFELLGLFLSMTTNAGEFASLLALACPSCRTMGFPDHTSNKVIEFLVLSQRVKVDRLAELTQAEMEAALGLVDGCRDDAGVPVEPFKCCPHAEAHVCLQLMMKASSMCYDGMRGCTVPMKWVPYQLGHVPALAVAAAAYYGACDTYASKVEREDIDALQRAEGHGAGMFPRKYPLVPPKPPQSVLPYLDELQGGQTWAEELFQKVLPDVQLSGPATIKRSELQARLQDVYAYSRDHFPRGGGFFEMTICTSSSYFRAQSGANTVHDASLVYRMCLFTMAKVFQHAADSFLPQRGHSSRTPRCLCPSATATNAAAHVLAEEHVSYMAALRRCRDEQHLLVDEAEDAAEAAVCGSQNAVDVDVARAAGDDANDAEGAVVVGGDASYYSAGSYARFCATLDATADFSAATVVDYVARITAEAAEALPVSAVPQQYIHAELKRHQLENVQWMWAKETEGYGEYVQVPLYTIVFAGAAATPVVRRCGSLFHCAATVETIVQRQSTAGSPEWNLTGTVVRGGLLCDDVGLGKTLSILALCAYDRAINNDFRDAAGADAAQLLPPPSPRFWQVQTSYSVSRVQWLVFRPEVLQWGFGPSTFRAGTAALTTAPTHLPRTTLVVVPLSIATQWIEELQKFYPTASYILFYGTKRTQYTVDDLQRADFVITTYETLSTHLRQETDGMRFWMARSADVADDAACAEAASQGLTGCRPPDVHAGLMKFATSTLWPELPGAAGPESQNHHRRRGLLIDMKHALEVDVVAPAGQRRGRGGRGGRGAAPRTVRQPNPDLPPPRQNAWSFAQKGTKGVPVFHCPLFSLYLNTSGRPGDQFSDASYVHERLSTADDGPNSAAFLDALWELLKGYSAAAEAQPLQHSCGFSFGLFDENCHDPVHHHAYSEAFLALVFFAENRYPMSDHIRRLFARHVLLPSLWLPFEKYMAESKAHFAEVAAAAASGRMPLRLLDLRFRRIVLDESQKCSVGSLFHLLQGDRRWTVSGTPLNNNKVESLSAALSFLGMNSAAQLLRTKLTRGAYLSHYFLPRHRDGEFMSSYMSTSRVLHRVRIRLEARRRNLTAATRNYQESRVCLCATCTQRCAYGTRPDNTDAIPFECRPRNGNRRYTATLPCLPNAFMEILALTMVRHERNQQVNRELQLPPVQYVGHRTPLMADEMQLYDRVAQVVMRVAALLHRQGLLTSRMGYALQWVQELCRLCLHPSRVGNAELLHGDIEAHVRRATRVQPEDVDVSVEDLAPTFLDVTPQAALDWALNQPTNPAKRARNAAAPPHARTDASHVAPEETVSALRDLVVVPPVLPTCGVCMDDMATPTLLQCFHLFCKECIVGVLASSRGYSGRLNAKCPYCRDPKSMLEEKLVIQLHAADAADAVVADSGRVEAADAGEQPVDAAAVNAALARIGDGSRLRAFVELVKQIWSADPSDGVLVFSKYPGFLQMAYDEVQAAGYTPFMVRGASTMVQRQRVMRALQQPTGAASEQHRILFVTSRSANAGLNLTFANHVIFLEPNLNPAMEHQAVGRVHRFGQLKRVTVHHLYAPRTIEQILYNRSVRLRQQQPQEPRPGNAAQPQLIHAGNQLDVQRPTQFGRIAPAEILLLLEYPIPPQEAAA